MKGTSDTIIEAASASCTKQCLQNVFMELLEPIVRLEIIVDEKFQQFVIDDLNRRRFQMELVDSKHGNQVKTAKFRKERRFKANRSLILNLYF